MCDCVYVHNYVSCMGIFMCVCLCVRVSSAVLFTVMPVVKRFVSNFYVLHLTAYTQQ